MPTDRGHRSLRPNQEVGAGQTAGYVGGSADAAGNAAALIPSQSTPNDVMDIQGAGAPVDGAVGTGTGAGQAGIGSRYTDITAGDLYLNAGTKASPVWKLVTRAA